MVEAAAKMQQPSSGRVSRKRCRISRNKKQYWKKGAQVQDAEDFLHEMQTDENEGGRLWERKDENLYTIDREPESDNDKLTRRQVAALMKRLQKKEPVEQEEIISKRQLKRTFPKKQRKQMAMKTTDVRNNVVSETRKPYDLWGGEEQKEEVSVAEEYYLRATKRKLPREPKTVKHITSILPHVEVDAPGASYNPPVSKYLDYVAEAAKEEAGKVKENEKIEQQLALAPGEKYVTQAEKEAEISAGLDDNDEVLEVDGEAEMNDDDGKKPVLKTKAKTRKARQKQRMERKQRLLKKISKSQREQLQLVFSARKLNEEISEEMRKRQELMEKRRGRKLLKRFAGTQRLGRGKFEPCEKPVLLAEELPGSLRELKPQGSIIEERLKSLQKRNMLSIPGEERRRKKLKKRLRFKEREDRKYEEVKLGTRMI